MAFRLLNKYYSGAQMPSMVLGTGDETNFVSGELYSNNGTNLSS